MSPGLISYCVVAMSIVFLFCTPFGVVQLSSNSRAERKHGARLLLCIPILVIFAPFIVTTLLPAILVYGLYRLIHIAIYGD